MHPALRSLAAHLKPPPAEANRLNFLLSISWVKGAVKEADRFLMPKCRYLCASKADRLSYLKIILRALGMVDGGGNHHMVQEGSHRKMCKSILSTSLLPFLYLSLSSIFKKPGSELGMEESWQDSDHDSQQ